MKPNNDKFMVTFTGKYCRHEIAIRYHIIDSAVYHAIGDLHYHRRLYYIRKFGSKENLEKEVKRTLKQFILKSCKVIEKDLYNWITVCNRSNGNFPDFRGNYSFSHIKNKDLLCGHILEDIFKYLLAPKILEELINSGIVKKPELKGYHHERFCFWVKTDDNTAPISSPYFTKCIKVRGANVFIRNRDDR